MLLKKLNHFHRTWKVRRGKSFAVLGYPRSGTTMLSEIVASVTDYYFDRDNVFPSSSKVVLHTHWKPSWFPRNSSVYIVRDPIDVSLSVIEYAAVHGWHLAEGGALNARKISKLPWRDHVSDARKASHHIVIYERLVAGDEGETTRLAEHIGVPADWISMAMALLGAKHANQPHESDVTFRQKKAERRSAGTEELKAQLMIDFAAEVAAYQDLLSRG
ncbi:sulfotransferase domain-containing protein [Rhodovulum sulfidophilum]|uniref:sulfotransferase domain-containing protein n=1 Tax=Rhodovulum sulfidophilum TaxID=35806 RepID=UPI001921D418|nr:sulfotransferase domain-containing protein [Rhodovulum sulfidophilum]MBL3566599.1 sulfotransferase domain-containing protein [Rhodovulum sulfidophilum]